MLNIILPILGQAIKPTSHDYENQSLVLNTIKECPIIVWAISHIEPLPIEKQYFVISADDYINDHFLDKVFTLFSDSKITFVRLNSNTKGMPCSILMAMDLLNKDEPFLVTSADQYLNIDLKAHLDYFKEMECDAGCIGFQSVHPKWSYAEINEEGLIERVAEKIPISKNALTSSYYFSTGRIMIDAIKANILRGDTVGGKYYLSPCLNELIIAEKRVVYSKMDASNYFNFYSKEKINDFNEYLSKNQTRIEQKTSLYSALFNARDLEGLKKLMLFEISLEDSFTPKISGMNLVVDFFASIFRSSKLLKFEPLLIASIATDTTMIKFKLQINSEHFEGVDIIKFRSMKILSISAYLHKIEDKS